VAAANGEVVARLARVLEAWKRAARSARLKPDDELAKELSPEQLETLRSLGYVK
jgi:hypothetical protein